jgi:hypothetical protein
VRVDKRSASIRPVDEVDQAWQTYRQTVKVLDELWPRYKQTLAIQPLTPGHPAPELSADDRAAIKEWADASTASGKALAELQRLSGRR